MISVIKAMRSWLKTIAGHTYLQHTSLDTYTWNRKFNSSFLWLFSCERSGTFWVILFCIRGDTHIWRPLWWGGGGGWIKQKWDAIGRRRVRVGVRGSKCSGRPIIFFLRKSDFCHDQTSCWVKHIVRKGVPDAPFLRHPPLEPVCLSFLKSLFPLPFFLFHPLLK